MGYKDFNKDKQNFFEKAKELLSKKVASSQLLLFSLLSELIVSLDTDLNNRIKFTAKNLTKTQEVSLIIESINKKQNKNVATYIGQQVLKILGINKRYFKTIEVEKPKSIDDKVRDLTMKRLGYNPVKKQLVKGGWLENLTSNTALTQQVSELMNQSIAGKMDLKTFQKQFKNVFIDPNGLGMLERHYYTNTFDIFQQYDRQVGKEYADKLGLGFAIYSGTIKKTTRPFCEKRNNHVYSKEEIESWQNLNFQGKPKIYNPVTMLGGHNCRHHLSWISDELAKELGNINTYS